MVAAQQIQNSLPLDANGNPLLNVVPATFGLLRAFDLVVPAGDKAALIDATGFPQGQTMALFGWVLHNFSDNELWVSDASVADKKGLCLARRPDSVNTPDIPGVLAWNSDPAQTYVFNPTGGGITVSLILFGRFSLSS